MILRIQYFPRRYPTDAPSTDAGISTNRMTSGLTFSLSSSATVGSVGIGSTDEVALMRNSSSKPYLLLKVSDKHSVTFIGYSLLHVNKKVVTMPPGQTVAFFCIRPTTTLYQAETRSGKTRENELKNQLLIKNRWKNNILVK